ncbi:hypothetical protein SAMN05421868_11343 [Paenibacillus naphthalenovorans]|nr:hypothetical protein SAMN05421868_11343 [Paenibacillus naphthalenovorans]
MKLFSYYEKKDFPSFMLKRLLIYHQQPRKNQTITSICCDKKSVQHRCKCIPWKMRGSIRNTKKTDTAEVPAGRKSISPL